MAASVISRKLKNWGFVGAQFVLIALCLWGIRSDLLAGSTSWRLGIAWILFFDGLALGLWALWAMGSGTFSVLPEPVAAGTLCERGPYRWLCHPMYTAVILVCFSAWVMNPTVVRTVSWLLLVIVLIGKLKFEEAMLKQQYAAYPEYAQSRHRLVPGVW